MWNLFRKPQTEKTMTSPGTGTIAVLDEAPVRTNLAEELRVAEAAFAEATRKKRIHDAEIAETSRAVEATTLELSRVDGTFEGRTGYYESRRAALRGLNAKLPRLQAESQVIEKELAKSQAVVHRVRRQIIEHPVYAVAIAEQRRIIAEGVKVAEELWSGPLSSLAATVKRFEEIANSEVQFEQTTNDRLRATGLPELRAQLWNCGRSCVPSVIAGMPLDEIKANCHSALEQLRIYRGCIPAV